jgi:phosphopantetheine adenylyltransferase
MLNGTNSKLSPGVKTIFFMPPPEFMFVSSSTVREIAFRDPDADLSWLVTSSIEKAVKERINILK